MHYCDLLHCVSALPDRRLCDKPLYVIRCIYKLNTGRLEPMLTVTVFDKFVVHLSLSKAFWRYFFYYLIYRTETYMVCVYDFYLARNETSAGSDIRQNNSPIDPNYKNHPLW